ncbi:MAG TPA: flagellin [Firmicutes bacterium]|nr:flagellin [Bacillota bacterium]
MRIVNNISAMNTHRQLGIADGNLSKSLERLSSGLRINRAGDDAAGLAISEKMRAQIRGMNQAVRNAQDGISVIQTAEGALAEVHNMLNRMRELTVQAGNSTLTDGDKQKLNDEFFLLSKEITRIAETTEFNTMVLLSGAFAPGAPADAPGKITLQIGPNAGQTLEIEIGDMRAETLNVQAKKILSSTEGTLFIGSGSTANNISEALLAIDGAIEDVSAQRASLGAYQNRLEHTIQNLSITAENLSAAESRIRDADMPAEMAEFTKNQILLQSSTAMLAQANMKPQVVLSLLG